MHTSLKTGGPVAAVDIGGTFTDIVVLFEDGTLATRKVLTTPQDYNKAILTGLKKCTEQKGKALSSIAEICHGTTLGTNAVIERKGRPTGLLTTKGFLDVLTLRRTRFPEPFNLNWEKPPPLVNRRFRREVVERIAADGTVITPLAEDQAEEVVRDLGAQGVESLAVALINSYVNGLHEERLGEIIHRVLPGCHVTLSSRLLPQIGEYERTSTSVVNAYLMPILANYLQALVKELDNLGVRGPLFIAQSSGGLFLYRFAVEKPFLTLESGPAGGFVAASQIAKTLNTKAAVAVDMGGTTTKAAFIENGELGQASEFVIGAPVAVASRLETGAGYTVRALTIDMAEVGAGGGSIAWVDPAGVLHVGPESAGASPGPVCYDQGGTHPTVTDANVVLGYVNPKALAGGTFRISADKGHECVGRLASSIGKSLEETAYGIHRIANSNMMTAIRRISTQRGRDLRRADLISYGGSGPVHAVGLARSLGISRVIVPPFPGYFSSFGLLTADIEHNAVHSFVCPVSSVDLKALNRALESLEVEVASELEKGEYGGQNLNVERSAELKFRDRSGEVVVEIPAGRITRTSLKEIEKRFLEEFKKVYRHTPAQSSAQFMNLQVSARFGRLDQTLPSYSDGPSPLVSTESRKVYFGPEHGYLDTPVLSRQELPSGASNSMPGALIVEEADSSTIVYPGCHVYRDEKHNIVIDL